MAAEFQAVRQEMATEFAAVRQEMADLDTRMRDGFSRTWSELDSLRAGLAGVEQGLRKLGLEFEEFRQNSKVTLEMLSELMVRTGRHEREITRLKRRTSRVENYLRLKPLPNGPSGE